MKIAWVTENFVDVDFPIIKSLDDRIDIHWFISHHTSAAFFSDDDYQSMFSQLKNKSIILKTKRRNRNPLNLFHYLKIIRLIYKINADIIYIDALGYPYLHPLALLLLKNKKIIYAAHDVVEHVGIKHGNFISFYKSLIFKKYQYFQVFSDSQKIILENKYPNKSIFIGKLFLKNYSIRKDYNYIESSKTRFLFFGKIRPNKGLDILINAANLLEPKYPDLFEIKIAGDSQNWEDYKDMIQNNDIYDLKIRFISNDEIPEIFSNTDYVVLPYKEMTQSGVLMLAYNYNTPVIASNLKEFQNDIEDGVNGFLFENEDINSLAKVMETVINNKKKLFELKTNLKLYVDKNISIKKISQDYLNFFQKI